MKIVSNLFQNFSNLRNTALGGGQFKLPGRNFARYCLMLFILFCLVMRTAYQGMQFDLMLKVKFS
jgi:hypothetical protein